MAAFFDVTDESRQLAEIERQNEELENISEAVAHELRNADAITRGHIEVAAASLEDADEPLALAEESLSTAHEAATRVEATVDRLLSLLEYTSTVDRGTPIDVRETVADCAAADGIAWTVTDDGTLVGEPTRVEALFENAFGFAAAVEVETVAVTMKAGRLTLRFEGVDLPPGRVEAVLEYGQSVPTATAGMYLPSVRLVADAHH